MMTIAPVNMNIGVRFVGSPGVLAVSLRASALSAMASLTAPALAALPMSGTWAWVASESITAARRSVKRFI